MCELHSDNDSTLNLGGSFTIERAAELRELLLQQPSFSQVCLSAIGEIDCAGLQLLLAFKRQHPELALVNPSAAVNDLFNRLQLSHLLSA